MKLKIKLKPSEILSLSTIVEKCYVLKSKDKDPLLVIERVGLRKLWMELLRKHEQRIGKGGKKECTLSIDPYQYLVLISSADDWITLDAHPYEYTLLQKVADEGISELKRIGRELDALK